MVETTILSQVLQELKRQKRTYSWPDHIAAQVGIVVAEVGLLMKLSLKVKYGRKRLGQDQIDNKLKVYKTAIYCAAVCLRFIENLNSKTDEIQS